MKSSDNELISLLQETREKCLDLWRASFEADEGPIKERCRAQAEVYREIYFDILSRIHDKKIIPEEFDNIS